MRDCISFLEYFSISPSHNNFYRNKSTTNELMTLLTLLGEIRLLPVSLTNFFCTSSSFLKLSTWWIDSFTWAATLDISSNDPVQIQSKIIHCEKTICTIILIEQSAQYVANHFHCSVNHQSLLVIAWDNLSSGDIHVPTKMTLWTLTL